MNVTLITMGQGNPLALKRTIDSFAGLCNQIVFGDLLIFEEDRKIIEGYGCRMVPLPFNYIYKNGFATTLNFLSQHASNDMVIYMNVAEMIDEVTGRTGEQLLEIIRRHPQRNCYYFNHRTDSHQWTRLYNRHQLRWSGPIHEELVGGKNYLPEILFTMKDSEKDMDNLFKANVYNTIKELVYTRQYVRIIEEPGQQGATNDGWIRWAKEQDPPMRMRLEANPFYLAFERGDIRLLYEAMEHMSKDELMHESSKLINFQGARLDML